MYFSFSSNMFRPNLPLRKPSSSPVTLSATSTPSQLNVSSGTSVLPASGASGDGPIKSAVNRDSNAKTSVPPSLTVHFCNYCGQQGNFRCMRCKKTPYCSVVCQTEDWRAHRHICKAVDPEPAKEKPKETTASQVPGDGGGLPESKHSDGSILQKVCLKDLNMTKVKGPDIQATVLEFYNPGRFFILAKSPELLAALQSISTELQKTYRCPSVTTYVPCVGEVCTVQFSCDMSWYRGLVQTLSADQKMANILYIDFGNEEDVPVERIKPLPPNIQPFCPCAMECRIARVVPVSANWSDECCMAVRQLLAGKAVTIKLVEGQDEGRVHAVDILLSMGKQLSTFLIECGYAAEELVTKGPNEMQAIMSASLENFRHLSVGKDDNSWAQPPEPLMQAVGDSFSVVVTHLQSPSEIIVQKVENAGVIQELQMSLREYGCQVPAPQNFRPAPGTVCCAQFSEDKQWYRAKVLAYSSEERVCVGYLDFGNSEEVDIRFLRPITASLLALPMQAIPCGLAGVQPVEGSWSVDCRLALQRRVSNRILRIEILGAHRGKALVAMIDEASDPQANMAELLNSAGFSVPAPITSSDQQADQTPTAAAEPPGVCIPASEPLVWSYIELPCDGQTVPLLASVVMSPGEFYCRINNPTDHQQLIELGAELKRHCEAEASPFVPKEGDPCCAMCPGNGEWYRAMVDKLTDDKVSVKFVDYGYNIQVEKNHIRSITPQLLTLPFQAVRCELGDVEPLGSEWSSEALLWFQTLVEGKKLSGRVLSVSEQGYNVELQSRGQEVAAALISEQLAKAPGVSPKEMQATTGSEAKCQEKINENEPSQIQPQASGQTGASSKDVPAEPTATLSEALSFPVDWKTVELPLNETFQPYIAAVINPSLFYLLGPTQVDQQKLRGLMMELNAYGSNNQASLSSAVLSRPVAGAACCAQFSDDNNWYRAVVLEVGENEMRVVYADYSNTEKVPFSRVLPIPTHLLQLPFQITRCSLTGKEHFPAEWKVEVLQLFQSLLLNGVLATVQAFDGSSNMVSLSLPTERGGGDLTAMMLDALQVQPKGNLCPSTTQKAAQTDSSTSTASTTAAPDCPQPKSIPKNPSATTEPVIIPEPAARTPLETKYPFAVSVNEDPVQKIVEQMEPLCKIDTKPNDPQTSGCCCASLTTKIDHLEQLMQWQLSLIKQLVGQTK